MSTPPIPDFESLLGKTVVCKLLGLSPRGLENLVKRGEFPPPVRVGKCVWWSPRTVQGWRQQLFAEQENWQPQPGLQAEGSGGRGSWRPRSPTGLATGNFSRHL